MNFELDRVKKNLATCRAKLSELQQLNLNLLRRFEEQNKQQEEQLEVFKKITEKSNEQDSKLKQTRDQLDELKNSDVMRMSYDLKGNDFWGDKISLN